MPTLLVGCIILEQEVARPTAINKYPRDVGGPHCHNSAGALVVPKEYQKRRQAFRGAKVN